MTQAKPFAISKREVWEAFKKVKANLITHQAHPVSQWGPYSAE